LRTRQAQNLELVAEHHQLDVLHIRATATADEQAKQAGYGHISDRALPIACVVSGI